MLVERRTVWTKVVRGSEEEMRWLRRYLSFSTEADRFRKAGSSMWNEFLPGFPGGVTEMVRDDARAAGHAVDVVDLRVPPVAPDPSVPLPWLRGYQREAVEQVHAAHTGILWMPTASGKTEVMAGLALTIPTPWLYLVPRTILAEQTAARLAKRAQEVGVNLPVGLITRGRIAIPAGARVVCATFQSLAALRDAGDPRALGILQAARALAVDECHVVPAEGFFQLALATANAHYRVGLSATPLDRSDRRSLLAVAMLGPLRYRVDNATLVAQGAVAKPRVRLVRIRQAPLGDTWHEVYGEFVARSDVRNRVLVGLARRAVKPAMLFVVSTEHGEALDGMLRAEGVRSAFVWGKTKDAERVARLRDLREGRLDVLVSSDVLNTGVDAPEVRTVILGAGRKSAISVLQSIGRGTRVDAGKSTVDVLDPYDLGCGCTTPPMRGLAHRGCVWLEEHSRKRRALYLREGYEVSEEDAPSLAQLTAAARP